MPIDRETGQAILAELYDIERTLLGIIGLTPDNRDNTRLQSALDKVVSLQRRIRRGLTPG